MAHRKNDYRLTRRGGGIDINKKPEKVVFTFEGRCPNCQSICEQEKIERDAPGGKGKKSYQLRCTNCGFKRFDEFADRSNYKSPDAKKGREIQAFQEYLWDWLRDHIEEIIFLETPEKINIFKGRLGTPRRHKGKPVFSSEFLHPDLVRYIDTPDYIKILSKKIKALEKDDVEAFDFILFRAWGYSYPQIDETKHFLYSLTSQLNKFKLGKNNYRATDYCRALNGRATKFLIDSIPSDLLNTFASKVQLSLAIDTATTNKRQARFERVTCPKCNGKNKDCILCHQKERKWDGTVPKWLRDNYLKKVSSGEWKE